MKIFQALEYFTIKKKALPFQKIGVEVKAFDQCISCPYKKENKDLTRKL